MNFTLGISVCANILGLVICIFILVNSHAQTRAIGPWWPNEEWGADDESGASNRITPAKVLEALSLASTGKIYELGQVYDENMPIPFNRTYSLTIQQKGSGSGGANKVVGNQEFLAAQIGQVGTQFDGLGHIGMELMMESGLTESVFYNGYTAKEMDGGHGLKKLGMENVKPIVTRGILVDIAGYKEVDRLPNSYEVTLQDVLGALYNQGLSEFDITPGDAVFFRYGWSSLWSSPEEYNSNPPGIGLEVGRWVAERKVTMVGSDSYVTEVIPNPDPTLAYPVHQELMMKNGIFNLENMDLDPLVEDDVSEFLFIVTTIRFRGATGSPVRPIAIR